MKMFHPLVMEIPDTGIDTVEPDFHYLATPSVLLSDDTIQTSPLKLNKEYSIVPIYLRRTKIEFDEAAAIETLLQQIDSIIFAIDFNGKETFLAKFKEPNIVIIETDTEYKVTAHVHIPEDRTHNFAFNINKRKLHQFGLLSLDVETSDEITPEYKVHPIAFIPVIKFQKVN